MDRVMEEGSRVRLGIDVYKSPSTGTQYVVDNTQNYYWVNAKGNVMGTGTDTAPGAGFSKMTRVPPQ
jgi:cytochrome oxidase Cu insertion factor (SCO1/SenC/PrrC family)